MCHRHKPSLQTNAYAGSERLAEETDERFRKTEVLLFVVSLSITVITSLINDPVNNLTV